MAKTIKMTRKELVWETREVEWNEVDFNRLKKWLKEFAGKNYDALDNFARSHLVAYEHIKDMTWEEVFEDFKKWDNGDEDAIHWTFTNYYNSIDDYTYTQYLGDLIQEWIREDCYDADITDVNYADDSEENIKIIDDEDKEEADA